MTINVQVGLKLSILIKLDLFLSHTDLTLERRFLSYCAPKGAAGKSGLFQIPNNLNWELFFTARKAFLRFTSTLSCSNSKPVFH